MNWLLTVDLDREKPYWQKFSLARYNFVSKQSGNNIKNINRSVNANRDAVALKTVGTFAASF
jgi:hypothetical protein